MARARNIKPSIMSNDELAGLEPLCRLLFIYMWMLADRDGRLEDKPAKIAAQAVPYDRTADVPAMLESLQAGGFIRRYVASGIKCIQIVNFLKHQNPHVREVAGELPAEGTEEAVTEHNLGSASAQPEPERARLIASSLIPDSGFLIVDSVGASPAPVSVPAPSPAAVVCMALKAAGIGNVNPDNQTLRMLLSAGAEVGEFVGFAGKALENAPGGAFAYVLRCVQGEREKAAQTAGKLHRGAMPNKQQALENRNRAVGADWLAQQGAA